MTRTASAAEEYNAAVDAVLAAKRACLALKPTSTADARDTVRNAERKIARATLSAAESRFQKARSPYGEYLSKRNPE